MSLNSKWKDLRNTASTENVLMTISEIIAYYQRGRLNINPAYQRVYRWSNDQKTKFIESLLLRYPIPPIIAIKTENENGLYQYEIIDGVQRLSTIFEFVGAKNKEGKKIKNSNEKLHLLEGANEFKDINGKNWEDFKKEEFDFIFESTSLLFINLTTNVDDIKFEIFERLNSLSSDLSTQEIRNSILALKNKEIFLDVSNRIKEVSKNIFPATKNSKRIDMEYFLEFSLIKRYNDYIGKINKSIKEIIELKSKDKNKHYDLLLSAYTRLINMDQLKEDLLDYEEFLNLNKNLDFKKYNTQKKEVGGSPIKFFFEILCFLFFKEKKHINEKFYQKYFYETYGNILKNNLKRSNPNAKTRFDIAKEIVERFDGNELFN